jgi:hypothetical protein
MRKFEPGQCKYCDNLIDGMCTVFDKEPAVMVDELTGDCPEYTEKD